MERIDDLQFQGLKIIQDDGEACFTEDAVLLANYLRAGPQDRVVDLGAGGGIISILAAAKTGAKFVGIEKRTRLVELARRSAAMNAQAIEFFEMDVRDAPRQFGHGSFTVAVSNPPYFDAPADSGQSEGRALARHGGAALLDAFLEAAFLLLKNGSNLYLCWPVRGLTDALCLLRARRLEPKGLRLVCQGKEPRLALITAKKLGKSGLCGAHPLAWPHGWRTPPWTWKRPGRRRAQV
jgi:tRNA1Val (adenine37-N6)-methyltransferase